ncbi:UNVERIFIED_CONTAM: hypothetical protein K2H54_043661 [Gekko kuhli]
MTGISSSSIPNKKVFEVKANLYEINSLDVGEQGRLRWKPPTYCSETFAQRPVLTRGVSVPWRPPPWCHSTAASCLGWQHICLIPSSIASRSCCSVMVEWIEEGTNKGKKVVLGLVFALNPHLVLLPLATPALPSDQGDRPSLPLNYVTPITKEKLSGDNVDRELKMPGRESLGRGSPSAGCKSPCMLEVERLCEQWEKHLLELLEQRPHGHDR